MKVKRLIEKIENLNKLYGEGRNYVVVDTVLELVEQLDEPEKVVVPQFVADWIEYCKVRKITLAHALYHSEEAKNKSVYRWLFEDEDSDNQELFARAWLDGYEVEKEKMYRISMPKARNYKNHAQILCEKDSKIFWCGEWHRFRTKFTRKQLEDAGFGWVFDCPGVEIEEVDD